MHTLYDGVPTPSWPILGLVHRASLKYKSGKFPAKSVQVWASDKILQNVWHLGRPTSHLQAMKDCTLVVFAFSLNGLSASSVLSLKCSKVFIQCLSAFWCSTMWKGQVADREQLVEYHATNNPASPLDLFQRWLSHRPPAELLFVEITQT